MGNSQSAAAAPVDKEKAREEAKKTLIGSVFDKVRGTSDKVTITADNFVPAILHECNQEVTLRSAANVHAPTLDVYLPFSDTENKGKDGVYDRESFVALLSNLAEQVSAARLAYVEAVWAAAEGGSGATDKVKVEKLVSSIKSADSLDVTDEARELHTASGENYNSYVAKRVGTDAAATFTGKTEVTRDEIEAALEQPRLSEHDVVRALHGESLGFSKANIAGKAVGTVGKVGTDAFACFTCAPDEDDKYRIKEAKGPRACFNTVTFHSMETAGEKKARKEAEAKAAVEKEAKEKKEKEEAEKKKKEEAAKPKASGAVDTRSCDFACFDPEMEASGGAGTQPKPKANALAPLPVATPASKRATAFAAVAKEAAQAAINAEAGAKLAEAAADLPADVKARFAERSAAAATAKTAAEELKAAASAADATDASITAALDKYNTAAAAAGALKLADPALASAEGATRADAMGISAARQMYVIARDAATEACKHADAAQSKVKAAEEANALLGHVTAAKHCRDEAFKAALAALAKQTAAAAAASNVDLSAVLEAAKGAQASAAEAKSHADAVAERLSPVAAAPAASSSAAGAGAAAASSAGAGASAAAAE